MIFLFGLALRNMLKVKQALGCALSRVTANRIVRNRPQPLIRAQGRAAGEPGLPTW
jgi:hypothetical protein